MSASLKRMIPFIFDPTLLFRLCEGGELFFFITKRKHLTEAQAALVMRQAFYALNYLHTNRICHRYVVINIDEKPHLYFPFELLDVFLLLCHCL